MVNHDENPMGLMGFEFVEFASPNPGQLEELFPRMGFTLVARHRSKQVLLYRQGGINFIVNNEPHSQAAYFAAEHGPRPAAWPSACATPTRPMPWRCRAAPSPSRSRPARWSCACRPSRASAARRST
jgi:hypothetical protein